MPVHPCCSTAAPKLLPIQLRLSGRRLWQRIRSARHVCCRASQGSPSRTTAAIVDPGRANRLVLSPRKQAAMTIASFFQNLLDLFVSIQIPAGTVALVGGGVAAAFKLIHWHTLFEI